MAGMQQGHGPLNGPGSRRLPGSSGSGAPGAEAGAWPRYVLIGRGQGRCRMSKAAELIVKCLENEGVEVVFGLPGEENIRFVQALASSNIRYVLTRHEQAASFMAEMYGRVTGRAAVVSATLGPGAINMQLGVAAATTNSTPVAAISAQVGQDREYKESHQSVDLVSMFAPITRWSAAVPTPNAIPEMVRKAFKTAETERPAAVYLAVPEHIDEDETDY